MEKKRFEYGKICVIRFFLTLTVLSINSDVNIRYRNKIVSNIKYFFLYIFQFVFEL